jgi:cytochrome c biogenesis protein CcmG/thiol:disulfide interchange protein DsbE
VQDQETKLEGSAAVPVAERGSGWLVTPLLVFLAVALLFGFALMSGDPSKLPSALIGRAVPQTTFAPIDGLLEGGKPVAGFSSADLAQGKVAVVNFWASWCAPCVEEHPLLSELEARTGVAMFGVNYKDQPEAARRFLGRYGNPFSAVGADPNGRNAIEWGVYGMPETFVIDGQGRIAFKHVGPISWESLEGQLLPAVEKAKATATAR